MKEESRPGSPVEAAIPTVFGLPLKYVSYVPANPPDILISDCL